MARQLTPPQGGFMDKASQMLGMSAQSYSMQQKKTPGPPGKTIGGGLMMGAGGAMGGAMAGAAMGSGGGPWGAAIGGVVGLASYFLS
jgi:hypothetical protein